MKMKLLKTTSILISLLLLFGCANLDTVKNAPTNAGISKVFNDDYELVKAAALASMQNLNINIKETQQTSDGFVITFTKAISAFSWGEVGRVLVIKKKANSSEVFVHSEKRSKYQITGADERDFALQIFLGIDEILIKRP